ncbi:MAG: hypothetical protein LBN08_06600 [Lactobacillales bacterium]|jgi:hypothetical protein|nr:hypothetical protein [Lactobacillales bacterium]
MQLIKWLKKEIVIGDSIIKPEQGVITIFAMALLIPCILFAGLMIETGRYIEAKSIGDVTLQGIGNDVMTNYDQYTYQRFGVMSYDQNQNMQQNAGKDIEASKGLFAGQLSDILVQGQNPLSDIGALQAQITGYSEYNGLGGAFTKFVKLDKILSMFDDLFGATQFSRLADAAEDADDELSGIQSAVENAGKAANDVQPYINSYDTTFANWSVATREGIDLIKMLPKDSEGNTDTVKLDAVRKGIEPKYKDYVNWHTNLIQKFETYQAAMIGINAAIDSYNDNENSALTDMTNTANQQRVDEDKADLDTIDAQLADPNLSDEDRQGLNQARAEMQADYEEALAEQAQPINREGLDGIPSDVIAKFGEFIQQAKAEKIVVEKWNVNEVDENSTVPDVNTYHNLKFDCFWNKKKIEDELGNNTGKLLGGTSKNFFSSMKNLFDGLNLPTLFADHRLDAKINTNYYKKILALKGDTSDKDGITEVIDALIYIITFPERIVNDLIHLKFITIIKDIIDVVKAIVKFFKGIVDFVTSVVERIKELIAGRYDEYFVVPYFAFDFPSRINGKTTLAKERDGYKIDKSNLTGLGFDKMRNTPPDDVLSWDVGGIGGMLDGALEKCKSGDDYAFTSCELEYIFTGKTNELTSQEHTFFAILVLRLIPNLGATAHDKIISPLCQIPIVGPIIKVISLFAESLLDTFLLVNGKSLPIFNKKKCFIGEDIGSFFEKVLQISTGASSLDTAVAKALGKDKELKNAQDKNKDETEEAPAKDNGDEKERDDNGEGKEKKDKGFAKGIAESYLVKPWLEFDYSQHIFFMMFLAGNNKVYLNRISDLIEMEGTLNSAYEHYGSLKSRSDIRMKVEELYDSGGYYDLRKAYTRFRISGKTGTQKRFVYYGMANSGINKLMNLEVNVGY